MLAMHHGVLATFGSAVLANLGTEQAHRFHMGVAARDGSCGKPAYVRALHVQLDAVDHGFGVIFLETRARALKACNCTFVACQKAFFFDLTQHFGLR